VCSAVGILPLSLQYSYEVMSDFLNGAHNIDEHFFDAPLRENIPVLLGLLGVWNSSFMGYPCRALLPYSQALKRFPAHIQQVDMESNGKRVAIDGSVLPFQAGEVDFGEPGTNGQHSFYQLMHQGRVVPADFIGFMESQTPIELANEVVSNHDELMSNFFAQPDALAYGKSLADLIGEGEPEAIRAHKVFEGNRPSSSMLMTKLDAFGVGQLLAIYEHRTAVQGFIWSINSFDQFGVELGKQLANKVRKQLQDSRKNQVSGQVQGFNSSTSSLLEAYLSHGK
jgi:glucose-6-phosphate isomerase